MDKQYAMLIRNNKRSLRLNNRWVRYLVFVICGSVLFFLGLGVGHYKWPPFKLIYSLKSSLHQSLTPFKLAKEYQGEREILQYAFTNPVNEENLYYPPINSLRDIHDANNRIFMQQNNFENAYQNLKVIDTQQIVRLNGSRPVVKVRFRYQERDYEAFAYGVLPKSCAEKKTSLASLVIPGSGINQSLGIALNNPSNYHFGIMDSVLPWGKVYTFIKPNEDFLAWHDGNGKKINGSFIWNWHLNRKGSYSVSYLVQTLAFTKWLQSCFTHVVVAGLSQGGAATLLNGLQSKPTYAIVASGHSILNSLVEWSGSNQLIGVPGYANLGKPQHLAEMLRVSPTQWFFSWGKGEIGTYKIEAEERRTGKYIEQLLNVSLVVHEGGHIFPTKEIRFWLSEQMLYPK